MANTAQTQTEKRPVVYELDWNGVRYEIVEPPTPQGFGDTVLEVWRNNEHVGYFNWVRATYHTILSAEVLYLTRPFHLYADDEPLDYETSVKLAREVFGVKMEEATPKIRQVDKIRRQVENLFQLEAEAQKEQRRLTQPQKSLQYRRLLAGIEERRRTLRELGLSPEELELFITLVKKSPKTRGGFRVTSQIVDINETVDIYDSVKAILT